MGEPPPPVTPDKPQGGLLTVLELTFGIAVIVGGCVGIGILKQPGEVAKHLADPWLFLAAWLAGGIYVLLGAVSVAELAAMTPKSGAWYVFSRRALGEYAGFVTGWGHWLGLCSGAAYIYLQLAQYLAALFPVAVGREYAIAVAATVGLAALHWRSVSHGGRFQEITTLFKGIAFLALIVVFLVWGATHPSQSSVASSASSASAASSTSPDSPGAGLTGWVLLGAAVLAFQAILQTYDGWEGVIYFGEEVRDPARNLPRALILGTLAVVVLYLLVNASLLVVLPISSIAGHEMAVALAAERVFGSSGGRIVFALATVSILVACSAGTLQTPRVLFAMSRDRLFFPWAARVNAGGTPTVALALTTTAIVFFIATGTTEELLGVLAFFLVANYSLVYLALFVLRHREPNAPRPFRAWLYPWSPAAALLGSLVYLGSSIWADAAHSLYALVLLTSSVPLYFLVRFARERNLRTLAES